MPNKVKFSPSGTESSTIYVKDLAINNTLPNTGGGPSTSTSLYAGPDVPAGGYVIYIIDNSTCYVAADDTELLYYVGSIGGDNGDINSALLWLDVNSNYVVVNKEYPNIPTDGLVLAVDASFLPSYCRSQEIVHDISTNKSTGTITGEFEWATNPGRFLNSSGIEPAYVSFPYAGWDFSLYQTIIMWVKPDTGASTQRRNPYNQAYGGPGTITHEPAGYFTYYFGTNGGNASPYVGRSSSFTVSENELAFIATTRNQVSDTQRWYKNGSLIRTQTAGGYAAVANGSSPILIGDGYVYPYKGNIYGCWVYNRELSGTEISEFYTNTLIT